MINNNKIFSLVLTGIISLTIAIGIGRFSYTPILPFMLEELELILHNRVRNKYEVKLFFHYLVELVDLI